MTGYLILEGGSALSKTTVKDRRAHPRRAASLDLHGTAGADGHVARMVTRDLSLGGLYCTSTHDYPEMTRLAVRLMLPAPGSRNGDSEPLDVEAVVVRREVLTPHSGNDERYQFALYFTGMQDGARNRLKRYLNGGGE
jgi:hypothetical protein